MTAFQFETNPCRGALGRLGLLVLPLGALGSPGFAQTPSIVLSTSQDVSGTEFVDGDVLEAGGGRAPRRSLSSGHFHATTGFVPSDVDAFAHRPNATHASAASLVFSLLSDQAGYRDGDVLYLHPIGGADILLGEDEFADLLGVPGANLDVDALDFDDQGRMLFSLQADLAGTVLGDLEDGDVVRIETGGTPTLWMQEQDIQACVTTATGSSASINDVQALEWVSGELWVCVQSPSDYDGAVISCGGVPTVVLEEADVGLGGAELNALAWSDPLVGRPFLRVSPEQASSGASLDFEFHGTPNALCIVFMSGGTGAFESRYGGFGRWYFDRNDPWLNSIRSMSPLPMVRLDSNGVANVSFSLPPVSVAGLGFGGEMGWSFQMIELGTRAISAPFRVEET